MNVRARCAAQALRRLSFNREHHEDSTPKQCSMGLPCIHAGHQLHGKGDGAKAKTAPVNRRVPALQTAEQPKAATPPDPLLLVGGETAVFPTAKTQIQPPAHHLHLVDIRPQVFTRHRKGCNLRHRSPPCAGFFLPAVGCVLRERNFSPTYRAWGHPQPWGASC